MPLSFPYLESYNVYQQAGVQRAAALCWGVGHAHPGDATADSHFSSLLGVWGEGKDLVTALNYLSHKEVRNGCQHSHIGRRYHLA